MQNKFPPKNLTKILKGKRLLPNAKKDITALITD